MENEFTGDRFRLLKSDINRIWKNLNSREISIRKQENLAGLKSPAFSEFRDRKQELNERISGLKYVKGMSEKELNTLFKNAREVLRDLKYINDLKTSNVKGFNKFVNDFSVAYSGIKSAEENDEDLVKNEVWDVYKKLAKGNGKALDYKYDILTSLYELMDNGMTNDQKFDLLNDWYKLNQEKEVPKGTGGFFTTNADK